MFTKLTNTSKAAIFSVLVLCMAVGAALLIRFLGISSDPVIFSIWSCTPTLAALIMLLVVTRDGYSREGWKSLGLHRLGLNVWWIAFGLTLLITVAASAIVWATPLASFTWPEGGIIDPIISFFIFFGMSVVWFALAEEIGMRGYLQPRLMSLGRTAALVVVGLVFATWHMPLIFLARGAERNALLYVRFVQRSRRRAVGQYLELPGVRTSYEVEGQGEPVVLLLGRTALFHAREHTSSTHPARVLNPFPYEVGRITPCDISSAGSSPRRNPRAYVRPSTRRPRAVRSAWL
jgi:membrane protease YdiL (CAAX protease family)